MNWAGYWKVCNQNWFWLC